MIFARISKTVLVSIILSIVFTGMVFGQAAAGPTFEVATVKPSALDVTKLAQQMQATGTMPQIGAHVDKARALYTFMSLRDLIATAWSLKSFQVTGPDWINDMSLRFDIVGKMPDGSSVDQAPQMLQALLAERFKLTVHRETKEHPVMALVVGKGGPKLQESKADPAQDFDENTPLKPGERQMDTPQGPVRMMVDPKIGGAVVNMGKRGTWTQKVGSGGTLHLEGAGTTMSAFADMLTQMTAMTGGTGTQIVDMTGLTGHYAVAIDFSLADLIKMAQAAGVNVPMPAGGNAGGVPVAADPGASSSISDAVQALGLKLESRKAPTEQLIVDHVEKLPKE
jgi:uncharacterized protein (TIGR03435 family)